MLLKYYYIMELWWQLVIIVCMHVAITSFIIVMLWNYSSVEGYSDTEGAIVIIRTHFYDE